MRTIKKSRMESLYWEAEQLTGFCRPLFFLQVFRSPCFDSNLRAIGNPWFCVLSAFYNEVQLKDHILHYQRSHGRMSKTLTGKLEEKIWSNSSLNYFEINDFLKRESWSQKHSWMLMCHCFFVSIVLSFFFKLRQVKKKNFFL